MGVFSSGGVGIDMGSANVTICLQNEGVVLREPSYVLTLRDDLEEILAVGRDARQMLGRTPKDVTLLSPIMDGAVGNIELATALLRSLSEKALGKRRALEKNRLVVSISQGCTRVEQEALEATVRAAGAKKAALLRTPVAAALGAGVPIEDERGCMMIVIGGSTTEVSVLSMNGIAAARATRTGGLALDEAIMRYVRREKGLIIGQRTAEDLKLDLGTARDIAMREPASRPRWASPRATSETQSCRPWRRCWNPSGRRLKTRRPRWPRTFCSAAYFSPAAERCSTDWPTGWAKCSA